MLLIHCNTYCSIYCNTHCNVHCNTRQNTAPYEPQNVFFPTKKSNQKVVDLVLITLQHTAICYNTLQHTSTHCTTRTAGRFDEKSNKKVVDLLLNATHFSKSTQCASHVTFVGQDVTEAKQVRFTRCCSVLQCLAVSCIVFQMANCSVLQRVAACCSVLQYVTACCSMLQCGAVCCSVLQSVVVCCSML